MAQLARRLAEILEHYGDDPSAHRATLDRLAALEARDAAAAHALFVEAKDSAARRRLVVVQSVFAEFPFLVDVPDAVADAVTLKEVDRAIRRFERALEHARGLSDAVVETRHFLASLSTRRVDANPGAFSRIAYERLEEAAENAEAMRRRAAREFSVEARHGEASRRASKLALRQVRVPDISSDAVPDADEAMRLLAEVEGRLGEAERVEDAYQAVSRTLRDPALREFTARSRDELLAAAHQAALDPEHASAVEALRKVLAKSRRLKREAAVLATRAARARKHGDAPPERERRASDLQDMYG